MPTCFSLNLKLTYISELLQEITKETSRYIRHSLRSGATPLSTKDEQIPQKIDQSYVEVDKLAQEKIQLAERVGTLIQRARTRLDYDLRRVLILQGEDPGQPAFVSTSRNPVQEMNDNIRLAIAESSPIVPPPPVVLPTAQAPTQKSTCFHLSLRYPVCSQSRSTIERKVTGIAAASSVKQPSPAPASTPVLPQRTRLAQQQSHRPPPVRGRQVQQQELPGPDEDAEGEDDVEEGNGDEDEDNEDKTLYCFCQKMSYGEVCVTSVLSCYYSKITNFYQMVACDNTECTYQWVSSFHINISFPFLMFRVSSFTSHALTSNRHCRRCGTALTVYQGASLVVWIVPGQNARRNERGRKDTMRHVLLSS